MDGRKRVGGSTVETEWAGGSPRRPEDVIWVRNLQNLVQFNTPCTLKGAADCKPFGAPADPFTELLIRALIFGPKGDG